MPDLPGTSSTSSQSDRPPHAQHSRPAAKRKASIAGPASHGPTPRSEYVRRVRQAIAADYTTLRDSPLCELPGVAALARTEYSRKIYPEASALRALLEQAFSQVLAGLEGIEDRRLQQVATYLRLARQHAPLRAILAEMGLRARSYVQAEIQPQALELLTDAFLWLARRDEVSEANAPKTSGQQ